MKNIDSENIKIQYTSLKASLLNLYNLKVGMFAILAIIITFPVIELNYGAGIDYPLMWVFNYLFHGNLQLGKDIIFPHGPLAFLMYPLKDNFILFLFVNTFIQLVLVYQVFNLVVQKKEKHERWLLALLISILLLKLCNFNLLIITTNALLYIRSYNSENKTNKYIAFILTALAFYVRSYVAIIAGIIAFCFIVYEYLKKRNFIETLKDAAILWILIFSLWILMYHSVFGFFRYCIGVLNLAQDNSSAAAYYPDNNWYLLGLFIISLILIPILNKSNKVKFFISVFALSIFAGWKHGMSREDLPHAQGLFILLTILSILFLIFIRKNTVRNVVLILTALLAFYMNLPNAYNYNSLYYEFTGVNNLAKLLINYGSIKHESDELTKKNVSGNILPDSVIHLIGKETVDIYPWDYSIIPTNNLQWKPRPVIHSYAAYTSWLDNEDANHFASKEAATYLIWQLNIITKSVGTGCFESIDGRYLLNDEPNAIVSILQNYTPIYKDNNYIVYKKRETSIPISNTAISQNNYTWNKWESVPQNYNDLLRLKVKIHGTILQKIKSFLYKDEFFYVYYKMSDSSILKNRIVPKNAEDGLWINPFVFDPSNNSMPYKVVSVMFKNSNNRLFKDKIDAEWVNYSFGKSEKANELKYPVSFFYSDSLHQPTLLLSSCNDFEKKVRNWNNDTLNIIEGNSFSGKKSFLLQPNGFSAGFQYELDSLPQVPLTIIANCWLKKLSRNTPGVKFIISVESPEGNEKWNAASITEQMIDTKWDNALSSILYDNKKKNSKLSIYLWNPSNRPILIDDINIRITSY